MKSEKITPEELWSRQQITSLDVDYDLWSVKRKMIIDFSRISKSCIFMVDVFKKRYDFASESFSLLFGYNKASIETIKVQGDLLEERIHPKDKAQLLEYQIEHGQFIYSLPPNERNDYQQIFQLRMLNANKQYINIISRHQVLETDKYGKAWIILGIIDVSPDQHLTENVKRAIINMKTGETIISPIFVADKRLTIREREVLLLIHQGFLSKEIASKLNLSIYTVNNHRKNILEKLGVDNIIEAINIAKNYGIIY